MAHFAKISEQNIVLQVLTLDNNIIDNNGTEDETLGQKYLETHHNWPAHLWIKTSYSTSKNIHKLGGTPFRGNYASIGYIWDNEDQIFLPKKPYASWVKHVPTASWKSPIGDEPELTEEQISQNTINSTTGVATHKWTYTWNEDNQNWDLINLFDIIGTYT